MKKLSLIVLLLLLITGAGAGARFAPGDRVTLTWAVADGLCFAAEGGA